MDNVFMNVVPFTLAIMAGVCFVSGIAILTGGRS